mmetsp:Transcript_6104/g.18090  ORF Transcript_6104/g.18090 Transcript_6104/m.18090 type:complete len:554 (-) Transcript_6104:686-2347(-)
MRLVGRVERRSPRKPLVPRPEGALVLLGVRVDDARVRRKGRGKVHDLVSEEKVEIVERHLPGAAQRGGLGGLEQRQQTPHFEYRLGVVGARLALGDESGGVFGEFFGLLHGLDEEQLELVAGPLDAMVGQVREVPQGAHRNASALVGLTALPVSLRLVRHDRVHVARGAHGPALEQWLLVLDALVVDVKPRLHVVQSVADAVQVHPERVVKCVLGLRADEHLQRLHLDPRVHHFGHLGRRSALRLADIVLPEQELPGEIGQLDPVGVRDGQQAITATTHAIQRVVLEELAPQRAATNHEVLHVVEFFHEAVAIHSGEVVVPRAGRRAVRGHLVGQRLHGVQVQEARDWGELAGELHHFLRHDAAQKGAERLELHAVVPHELGEQLLVHFHLHRGSLRGEQLLGFGDHRRNILLACGQGSMPVGLHGHGGVERQVDLQLRAEVDHVGTHHAVEGDARVLDRLGQGLEWVGGADLLLGHQPSTGVGRELRGVPDAHGVDWVARFRADLPGCHHVPTRRRLLVRGQTVAPHHIGKLHVAALGEGPWRLPIRHRDPH